MPDVAIPLLGGELLMAYDFVTIDFETANNNLTSACSVGIAAVNDLKIVKTEYYLIKPKSLDFDEKNVNIHGIKPEDVADTPLFPDVWKHIRHYFVDNMIIAHNAYFDMSVLKCCLLEYDLDMPEFNYLCSIPISTRACRGQNVGNSLKDRAEHFGISMDGHHNALRDAIICANLVIACIQRKKRKTFQAFCNTHYSLPIKKFSDLKPQTSFYKPYRKFERIAISEIAATMRSSRKN